MNNANLIISVSKNLIKYIKIYGVRNTFKVIPNTVDTEVFYPAVNKGKPGRIKRLLLVASLIPIKGIPYLLDALGSLKKKRKDFILDIVGDGPYREQYERYSVSLGLKDKVKFHGLKSKEEISRFMRNSDIFVLPSLWENMPCVLIEAMACGLPIITTKVGGISEIMNKKTGIMVESKNKEELSSAISHMLDHTQDYSKGQIASYAKGKFDFEVIGKRLDNIYKKILNRK